MSMPSMPNTSIRSPSSETKIIAARPSPWALAFSTAAHAAVSCLRTAVASSTLSLSSCSIRSIPPARLPPLAGRAALFLNTRMERQPLSEGRTPKRLLALGDRRGVATHATGVRGAQLVDGLYARPTGWSLEAVAEELDVSVRSVERYVRACADFITDRAGRPRTEIARHWGGRRIRLLPRALARESTVFQVAALRLARALLRLAGGTVLEQLLDDACDRLESVASP